MAGNEAAGVLDANVALDGAHRNIARETGDREEHRQSGQAKAGKRRKDWPQEPDQQTGGGPPAHETLPGLVRTDCWRDFVAAE